MSSRSKKKPDYLRDARKRKARAGLRERKREAKRFLPGQWLEFIVAGSGGPRAEVGIFVRLDERTKLPIVAIKHEGLMKISTWYSTVDLSERHFLLCENCFCTEDEHVNERCLYAPNKFKPIGGVL